MVFWWYEKKSGNYLFILFHMQIATVLNDFGTVLDFMEKTNSLFSTYSIAYANFPFFNTCVRKKH